MTVNMYSPRVRIDGHDVSPHVIEGVTVDFGRESVNEPVGSLTAELTLFTREGYPQQPAAWFDYGVGDWGDPSGFVSTHDTDDIYVGPRVALYIGAPVEISVATGSGFVADHDTQDIYEGGPEFTRFAGHVQAIEYSYTRLSVVCASTFERWSHYAVLAQPEPPGIAFGEQDEDQRISQILEYATIPDGISRVIEIRGLPGMTLLALQIPDFPFCITDALRQIAEDCDGLLTNEPGGAMVFCTRRQPQFYPEPYVLPSNIIDRDSLTATLELGDAETTVICEYGLPDGNGVRASVTVTDGDSNIPGRIGYYTPPLVNEIDAVRHANTILFSQYPDWHWPDIDLVMSLATNAQIAEICQLEAGWPVTVADLPPGAPVPTFQTQLLGWTDDLSHGDWVITLHLAPFTLPYIGGET